MMASARFCDCLLYTSSMVAVLICSLGTTCVDPNSTHPFSEFTVYPAPDSRTPLQFGTPGMGAPFLALQNGMARTCDDVFDPVTGKWYSCLLYTSCPMVRRQPRADSTMGTKRGFPSTLRRRSPTERGGRTQGPEASFRH